MRELWCNILDALFIIDSAKKKLFLWLAGFRNISELEIICSAEYDNTKYTMGKDGKFHKIIEITNIVKNNKHKNNQF